ncbi:MAG: uridine phosphorylase [Deltaproteobacteria bacterium]|nr:uridine phosphorylase [Deltaproteobacteria bacterium]
MSENMAHHLQIGPEDVAGNGDRGRFFLLPGSPARARRIADHFSDLVVRENTRRHDVYLGTLQDGDLEVDVATVGTGMGCPSIGIVVTELLRIGARRLLRVGTAGSLQPDHVHLGDLVVATAAVRDEGTSDALAPRDVPAVAHPDWIAALAAAARRRGEAAHTFLGVVHTKDSMYGREFPDGPLSEQNALYMAMLRGLGVVATEMESSHLFMLAAVHSANITPLAECSASAAAVKAGAVYAIVGTEEGFAPADLARAVEERMIQVGITAAIELARMESD